jgi:hypothetical protein
MSNFEKIVRPFETGGSPFTSRKLPARQSAEDNQEPTGTASRTWGANHPGDFNEATIQGFNGVEVKYKEEARTTDVVRVFQNNDENSPNWVDVERITNLTLKSTRGDMIEFNLLEGQGEGGGGGP